MKKRLGQTLNEFVVIAAVLIGICVVGLYTFSDTIAAMFKDNSLNQLATKSDKSGELCKGATNCQVSDNDGTLSGADIQKAIKNGVTIQTSGSESKFLTTVGDDLSQMKSDIVDVKPRESEMSDSLKNVYHLTDNSISYGLFIVGKYGYKKNDIDKEVKHIPNATIVALLDKANECRREVVEIETHDKTHIFPSQWATSFTLNGSQREKGAGQNYNPGQNNVKVDQGQKMHAVVVSNNQNDPMNLNNQVQNLTDYVKSSYAGDVEALKNSKDFKDKLSGLTELKTAAILSGDKTDENIIQSKIDSINQILAGYTRIENMIATLSSAGVLAGGKFQGIISGYTGDGQDLSLGICSLHHLDNCGFQDKSTSKVITLSNQVTITIAVDHSQGVNNTLDDVTSVIYIGAPTGDTIKYKEDGSDYSLGLFDKIGNGIANFFGFDTPPSEVNINPSDIYSYDGNDNATILN